MYKAVHSRKDRPLSCLESSAEVAALWLHHMMRIFQRTLRRSLHRLKDFSLERIKVHVSFFKAKLKLTEITLRH